MNEDDIREEIAYLKQRLDSCDSLKIDIQYAIDLLENGGILSDNEIAKFREYHNRFDVLVKAKLELKQQIKPIDKEISEIWHLATDYINELTDSKNIAGNYVIQNQLNRLGMDFNRSLY